MPIKLNIKDRPKLKPNPLFKGLPNSLKNPKKFVKIEKRLQDILYSDHKHPNLKSYAKCERCEVKRMKRTKTIKEIGFRDYEQYIAWKKLMLIIIRGGNLQLQ